MNLKITLGEILEIVPVLSQMSNMQFKGAISFKLGRLISILEKELALLQEEKNKIIKKYYNDSHNELNTEMQEKFKIEVNELLETVIQLEVVPVPEEAFYEVTLSARQASIFDRIIEKTPLV